MINTYIYYDYLNIYDDKVFTYERANGWKKHIVNCYEDVYRGLRAKIDPVSAIHFNLSASLLDEVIVDAIIGMRKITESDNNSVSDPNPFKIAAYLSYWWLRHKPVSLYYSKECRLENVQILTDSSMTSEKEKEQKRQELCWQLKHINELVAVQMVSTYIFDFENVVCDGTVCNMLKDNNYAQFAFEGFEDMREVFLKKLTYYFSYRAIAPKIIEHMLEAYTFHPAWGLTGAHWGEKEET